MEKACPESPQSPKPAASRTLRRGLSCLLQLLGLALVLALLAAGGLYGGYRYWAQRETSAPEAPLRPFSIEKGDSLFTVARRLESLEITGPAPLLVLLAMEMGVDRRLQVGEYPLRPGMAPRELLHLFARGPERRERPVLRVTLPEGWTMKQMAERLEKSGVLDSAEAFLEKCRDADFCRKMGLPGPNAQGFLFPDTYDFRQGDSPEAVIRRLTQRFFQVLEELDLRPGQNSPQAKCLLFSEYVILASIIEREVRRVEEAPLISAVYHNRLKRRMRLDSCATVRYALNQWEAPLKKSDLDLDSPYNTYRRAGLPPGPICNPGRHALEAAFRPAQTKDLYYVYRGDGYHAFSKSLREHNRARQKYKDAWRFTEPVEKEEE